MTTLPSTRSTIWHEAAHTAALIMQGLTPLCVRVDRPSDTLLGSVKPDWEHHDLTRDNLRKVIVAIAAGALQDGSIDCSWPIDPDGWGDCCQRDADQCAALCDTLNLEVVDWLGLVFRAQSLGRRRAFRELQVTISAALEERELLLQPELEAIAAGVMAEHGGN